jgi:hypothetical protein
VVGRGSLEPLWKQIVDAPTHEKGKKHKAITHGAGVAQPKVSADLPSADERLRGNIHSNVRVLPGIKMALKQRPTCHTTRPREQEKPRIDKMQERTIKDRRPNNTK